MKKILIMAVLAMFGRLMAADTVTLAEKPLQSGTRWVFYMNTSKVNQSNSGKLLVEVMKHLGLEFKLQKLSNDESLRLLSSVKEIRFSGKDGRQESALILLKGNFSADDVKLFLSGLNGYKNKEIDGMEINSWIAKFDAAHVLQGGNKKEQKIIERRLFAVSMPEGMLVLSTSEPTLVRQAKLLQAGKKDVPGNLAEFESFKQKNDGVALYAGAWDLQNFPDFKPRIPAIRKLSAISFYVAEVDGYLNSLIELKAGAESDAMLMKKALGGIKAYATLNAAADPVASIFSQGITLSHVGKSVNVNIKIDTAEITPMIMGLMMQRKAKKGGTRLAGN